MIQNDVEEEDDESILKQLNFYANFGFYFGALNLEIFIINLAKK